MRRKAWEILKTLKLKYLDSRGHFYKKKKDLALAGVRFLSLPQNRWWFSHLLDLVVLWVFFKLIWWLSLRSLGKSLRWTLKKANSGCFRAVYFLAPNLMVYSKKGKKQYCQRFCLCFNRQTESLIDLNANVPAVKLSVYKMLNWPGIILNFPTGSHRKHSRGHDTAVNGTLWLLQI